MVLHCHNPYNTEELNLNLMYHSWFPRSGSCNRYTRWLKVYIPRKVNHYYNWVQRGFSQVAELVRCTTPKNRESLSGWKRRFNYRFKSCPDYGEQHGGFVLKGWITCQWWPMGLFEIVTMYVSQKEPSSGRKVLTNLLRLCKVKSKQSSGGIGRRWEIILKTPWGKVNLTLISW